VSGKKNNSADGLAVKAWGGVLQEVSSTNVLPIEFVMRVTQDVPVILTMA
jgi:hypothetical protein